MSAKKIALTTALISALFISSASAVVADGTETKVIKEKECKTVTGAYGTTREECVEKERTEEVKLKEAGLADINFSLLAGVFGSAGLALLILSRFTKQIYLFD